ncbi:MAG: protein kinase domain-containing protein [Myxococcaceae bacterium]
MRAAEADDYIGRIIASKYRVEQLIGEGGMGKVYRAKQMSLDKPVVLKVLRQSLLSDERTVARFQREAKAASRLNHPNSISVLDFGRVDEDGALFIAMEFISGRDLHQILSKEWPLPEARVVKIVGQVLSALADAHGAGVIHRDLKPENIMVEQRRGDADFVKVLDFGIAKITDSTGEEGPALTRAGFVCGTPEYMSPEQARGGTLDHRSDLYAVGVILYQLTTGLLPFESDSAVGFATKHLTEEPPPPTHRRPEAKISPGMERLILRALSKNPDDRPSDAEGFRAELQAVDKERRAAASAARRGVSSPHLGPMPRKATPIDQLDTRVSGESPWGTNEQTVRQAPSELRPAGLRAGAGTSPERSLGGETTVALGGENAGGMLIFKIVTVALVVISVGLAGVYLYQLYFGPGSEPYQPPPNAPVRIDPGVLVVPPVSEPPLYEREIPAVRRDPERFSRLTREGDEAHQRGLGDIAAAKYQEAFEIDPAPELSLKLGEIYFQRNESEKARGWWTRHLRDQSGSKARSYIEQAFPEL